MWALFVDPAHEGRVTGRALLEHACSILREAVHARWILTTEPGTRAERFYRANGWRVVGTRGSELVLERAVDPVQVGSGSNRHGADGKPSA